MTTDWTTAVFHWNMAKFDYLFLVAAAMAMAVVAISGERGIPNDPNSPPPRYVGSCRQRTGNSICCSGRDSSCSGSPIASAAAAPAGGSVSLIGNLLGAASDLVKECYCDSACITLDDCCPDYKDTCGVQDCLVSEWGQWSECNATCGVGTMTRTRNVISYAQNGGKECPDLNQRRACHGQHCQVKDDEKMLREMAIILQSSFSVTRNVDEEKDIRRNLRLNYPKDPLRENVNEYCVLFEVTKSRKTCESLPPEVFGRLQEGGKVCVQCQDAAMRRHLGYRCYGHGIKDRPTRWSMFNFSGCHGRWTRMEEFSATGQGRCQCQQQMLATNGTRLTVQMKPDFIFV